MSLIEEAKARPGTARQVQSSSQNVTTPVTVATTGAAESKDLDGDSVQLVTNGENHDGQPVLIDQPDIVMLDGESIEDSNPSTFKSVFLSEPEEEPTPPAAVQPTVVQPTTMPIPTPTHTPTPAPVADPVAQSQPQSRPHSAPRFNNGRPQHHPLHSPVPRVHLSVPNHRTNTDSEIDQMIRRVEASASVSPALARSHSSDYRSGLHSLPSNPNRLGSGGGPPVKRTADDEGVMDNGMKKSKT
ncbi:hypothetical protein CROQUDRAFT_302826 [Cronartium quercuum f. sp. fusiforme G11]|nr:hypothetical protein CROQUDRAFT_302826 [Cronartium quercuum f. sp. fusiforme G11]